MRHLPMEAHQPPPRNDYNLEDGGLCALILGPSDDVPTDYAMHGQVKVIEGAKLSARALDLGLSQFVKVVVFGPTRLPDRSVFTGIHEVLKRRRLPYRLTDNPEHLKQVLDEIIPKKKALAAIKIAAAAAAPDAPTVAEQEKRERGAVKEFVETELPKLLQRDAVMPAAEAARHLFTIAQDKGLRTTFGSLQEAVRKFKRDHSVGERPQSAMPPAQVFSNDLAAAFEALENSAKILARVQVEYLRIEAENIKLKKQNARFKEVFTTFKDDIIGED